MSTDGEHQYDGVIRCLCLAARALGSQGNRVSERVPVAGNGHAKC